MRDVELREQALVDLRRLAAGLGQQSESAGERFVGMAYETMEFAAANPKRGRPISCEHPDYAEARVLPVRRFRWALLVYCETPSGIDAVRILHGATQLAAWLGERT